MMWRGEAGAVEGRERDSLVVSTVLRLTTPWLLEVGAGVGVEVEVTVELLAWLLVLWVLRMWIVCAPSAVVCAGRGLAERGTAAAQLSLFLLLTGGVGSAAGVADPDRDRVREAAVVFAVVLAAVEGSGREASVTRRPTTTACGCGDRNDGVVPCGRACTSWG